MKNTLLAALAFAATTFYAPGAQALPAGWTCNGNCGTMGADGSVTAPPNGSTYDYISTANSTNISGLELGEERRGSTLFSNVFNGKAGDNLQFYFNYITSDGSDYSDYAWARLLNLDTDTYIYLLTARTQPSGSIIPGTGMPDIGATLTPVSVPIIGGAPVWSPLGDDSGDCFEEGCGYTGWVRSDYSLTGDGQYRLEFGVVNWSDNSYQSGLAVSAAQINEEPIGDVPEPASALLIGGGMAALLRARRRSRKG